MQVYNMVVSEGCGFHFQVRAGGEILVKLIVVIIRLARAQTQLPAIAETKLVPLAGLMISDRCCQSFSLAHGIWTFNSEFSFVTTSHPSYANNFWKIRYGSEVSFDDTWSRWSEETLLLFFDEPTDIRVESNRPAASGIEVINRQLSRNSLDLPINTTAKRSSDDQWITIVSQNLRSKAMMRSILN